MYWFKNGSLVEGRMPITFSISIYIVCAVLGIFILPKGGLFCCVAFTSIYFNELAKIVGNLGLWKPNNRNIALNLAMINFFGYWPYLEEIILYHLKLYPMLYFATQNFWMHVMDLKLWPLLYITRWR